MIEPWPIWVSTPKGGFRMMLEPVGRAVEDLVPLYDQQYREMLGSSRQVRPDFEYYLSRGAAGTFAVIVVRDSTLQPVGYLGFAVNRSPYDDAVAVTEELFYLQRNVRGTALAQRMIEHFKRVAKKHFGASHLFMGWSGRDAGPLYRRAGLTEVAVVYGISLDEPNENSEEPGLRRAS